MTEINIKSEESAYKKFEFMKFRNLRKKSKNKTCWIISNKVDVCQTYIDMKFDCLL